MRIKLLTAFILAALSITASANNDEYFNNSQSTGAMQPAPYNQGFVIEQNVFPSQRNNLNGQLAQQEFKREMQQREQQERQVRMQMERQEMREREGQEIRERAEQHQRQSYEQSRARYR